MQVDIIATALAQMPAELRVLPLTDGQQLPPWLDGVAGGSDVSTEPDRQTLLWVSDGDRVLVAGLGDGAAAGAERLRTVAAKVVQAAAELGAGTIAWGLPVGTGLSDHAAAAAITEGTILGSFRFDHFRTSASQASAPPERLLIAAGEGGADALAAPAGIARAGALAQNRARTLQSLPANHVTPTVLTARARELENQFEAISVDALNRDEIAARGLGGLAAVSSGSVEEPALITLRYAPEGASGQQVLGLVGKAVTFDSGGISIKPSAGMQDMKMDMSGGAAVLEAVAAIAELKIPVEIAAVIPATENMPSGTAMKPGDVIVQLNGKTVEVNNTDAEGRLILADALTWCAREMGATLLVDLATLTGAALIALGSTYCALISNDDSLAAEVLAASEVTGELAWRLPLHPEYKQLTKGTIADLTNAAAKREAGTIYAASFLEEFTDDIPWVHLDIAGTAWDVDRAYWGGKGPTGFGVRLLVELARRLAT